MYFFREIMSDLSLTAKVIWMGFVQLRDLILFFFFP